MKYFLLLVVLTIFNAAGIAQTVDNVGKITLSVIMPENADSLDASQLSKLESKITQVVTASGLAASSYNNNFVIYPKFEIYESNVVEGGMQNITVVKAQVNLFIKQVDNNMLFTSVSKPISGSGSNKKLAITNAISKISAGDADFKNFIATGKQKIIQYYEGNCSDIVKKADGFVKMNQYEQALGLLMSVPEEVSGCYSQVQDKAITVYKAYQTQRCAELMQKAKTSLAAKDYAAVLNILSDIDPSASCYNEAQSTAKTVESKVAAEDKKQWDFQMKQYNDGVALEKERINAVKEIAVAYYKSKPTTVNYSYIVK